MKRAKPLLIVVAVIIFGIVVIFIVFDTVRYPLSGNLYKVLKVSKDDITAVNINHYGKIVTINDHETVQKVCNLLDVNLRRGMSDYFFHSTGAVEWTIGFVTPKREVGFGFCPFTINVTHTQIFWGNYWYFCEEKITVDTIEELWTENEGASD